MEKVSFTFYKTAYFGEVIGTEAEFRPFERTARAFIESITMGQKPSAEAAKMAVCAVSEVLFREADRDGLATEHNDGYIVTYDRTEPIWNKLWVAAWLYLPPEAMERAVALC